MAQNMAEFQFDLLKDNLPLNKALGCFYVHVGVEKHLRGAFMQIV
jgi:hypothetical protein